MADDTRTMWAKRVERWKDSGLTAKQFAAEVGVSANTLSYWKWRLSKGAEPKAPRKEEGGRVAPRKSEDAQAMPMEFIEVAPPIISADVRFEVVLLGGRRVLVPASFEAGCLRRLVDVLEARP